MQYIDEAQTLMAPTVLLNFDHNFFLLNYDPKQLLNLSQMKFNFLVSLIHSYYNLLMLACMNPLEHDYEKI